MDCTQTLYLPESRHSSNGRNIDGERASIVFHMSAHYQLQEAVMG